MISLWDNLISSIRNIFNPMNVSNKPCVSPFTFKLDDCLACSSCITDFTAKKVPSIDELQSSSLSFIISPHSKMNMYNHYKNLNPIEFDEFEALLITFLKRTFAINKVYDTSYIKKILYERVYDESEQGKLIISDCPGTVSYIERQGHHLIEYLSKTKTQQQVTRDIVRGRCVSVVQCYDKMMENNRDGTDIDYIITTYDFYKMIVDAGFLNYKDKDICFDHEKCNISYHYGYLDYIINKKYNNIKKKCNNMKEKCNNMKEKCNNINKKCNNINKKCNNINNSVREISTEFSRLSLNGKRNLSVDSYTLNKMNLEDSKYQYQVKPGTFLYTFTKDGSTRKYIRILGLEPFINFIRETKLKGLIYDVCEIYICNQGCSNGPGQVYTEGLSIRKEDGVEIKGFEDILDLEDRRFTRVNIKKINFQVNW
jgi:iron only hydrogenase large subunit-like protein